MQYLIIFTGETVCEGITIEVPERVLIPDAVFFGKSYPHRFDLPYLILQIKTDTPYDLSETCGEGLSFPQGKWPKFSMGLLYDYQKCCGQPFFRRVQHSIRMFKFGDSVTYCKCVLPKRVKSCTEMS